MLAFASYESDNRVRRYAETLAKRGDHVDVIACTAGNLRPGVRNINGVTVYCIQSRDSDERHLSTYLRRLARFLWVSSAVLTFCHSKVRYNVIHIHNMPDFLVFAAWYPKWNGARLILDIHDMVPELFVNRFGMRTDSWLVGVLKQIEKASAAFVDHVIVSNHIWFEKLVARSVPRQKCSVFVNTVDHSIFYRRARTRKDDRFIVLFPGSYQRHQGLDIALKAFALVKKKVKNAELYFYGRGPMEADLARLVAQLGLHESVRFFGTASIERIAEVIADADLGVVPKRADSFGNEAYSTKIMEFMSQGVPVVVSRTKIDSFYFDDSTVQFFTPGDAEAMALAMLHVIKDSERRRRLIENGYRYVDLHGWESKRNDYLHLIDSLSIEVSKADAQLMAANVHANPKLESAHDLAWKNGE